MIREGEKAEGDFPSLGRQSYGRSGCPAYHVLAHAGKMAVSFDVQHDGSDTAAVGPFPSLLFKKGHQRIRELSTCPYGVSDLKGPDLFLSIQISKQRIARSLARSSINMNSWTHEATWSGFREGTYPYQARRLLLLCCLEQV